MARSGVREGNLPAELKSFVGRRSEVREVRRLLTEARLLTLTGAGGLGKTRLALRVASDVRRTFSDGAWLVDLAPLEEGALLAQTVLAALGRDHDSARPPVEALTEYLADKQLLLVLDNCEHLLHSCAALTCSLLAASPGLRVLATSRQALGVDGEQLLPVPPLPVPDPTSPPRLHALVHHEAVRLFVDRASAVVPGFTLREEHREVVAGICHRLDGIPLAIELAAVWLRFLSPEEILERLDDRFGLLTRGSRAAPPRQQTLRGAIGWSFNLCTPPEQRAWIRLSVFSGAFDLEAAEAVSSGPECDPGRTLDQLAGLVDKSVLIHEEHPDGPRYRMLDTIREYGRGHLRDLGAEEPVRRRLRDHYQQLAARAEAEWLSPRQTEWFARLRREEVNIRTALEFCLSTPGEEEAGLQLVASLWRHRLGVGGLEEQRHWLGRALARSGPTPARAKALWVDGWLAYLRGETAFGRSRLAECQALAEELGDPEVTAQSVQFAGLVALFEDDHLQAIEHVEQALDLHRAGGDRGAEWTDLFLLALSCCLSGDPRSSVLGEECLALCDAHDARWSRPFALWLLGLHRWLSGDADGAIALLREGLRIERPTHHMLAVAQSLEVLAWAEAAVGRHAEAARLYGAAENIRHLLGAALPWAGILLRHHTECEEILRRALGDERYAAAVEEGRGLTVDQAVACGVGRGESPFATGPDDAPALSALTRREREVVALLAEGLSDKQIAAKLVLSPRTVEGHVRRILAKLHFTSRTQIATWAVQQESAR
ncbi:ATP-binding protein [Streptomyces coffeae]|uniref:AAA family ATPase n=1 Tax=Streptomyces coffeae TaxID=621382 RepID=A0ABS1NGH9_9ACTN|nr:LuxR C-terminal-related transcriptional regulator [Streptomyces coffeae]MBL1099158.1 AAA family ATPase [Streptomyces coffeae]